MSAEGRTRGRTELWVAAALAASLSIALAPAWPDDWDGLGFLEAESRFDLDAFAPHPPGYPVYVALLKIAARFLPAPMEAAKAVLGASAAATVLLLERALRRILPSARIPRLLVAFAAVATPLALHCMTVVGSEAPALAWLSLAVCGLASESPLAVGMGIGLGLGTRLSWAPLTLPLAFLVPRPWRVARHTLVWTAAWAVPFTAIVGPAHLVRLASVHLAGHATRWGGTALTEPARARFLLRDLFVDGWGVSGDPLGIAIGTAFAIAAVLSLDAWRRQAWIGSRSVGLVVVPYLVWVGLGQNLREQPRHVLPLVVLLALGMAVAACTDRRCRLACVPLFALVATRAGLDASARRREPPAGAALVEYVHTLPDEDGFLVFGGASMRFFHSTELGAKADTVASVGDVTMALTRISPPSHVLVTSEVDGIEQTSARPVVTFCRSPRLDRKRPCLTVYEIDPAGASLNAAPGSRELPLQGE